MLETNFLGTLRMSKAFAPILAANGGGALLNVLSVASWLNRGQLSAYAASKTAAWSLTNSLRYELAAQRTQVLALHMSFVDTDLAQDIQAPKTSADEIVKRALDALESGAEEVLADEITRAAKQGLTAVRPSYFPPTG
jgi:short-subunit dehydrogenase